MVFRYLYDGSFEGFLSVLNHLEVTGEDPEDIRAAERSVQECLWTESIHIPHNASDSERMRARIREAISTKALRHIYYAFLSEKEGVEMDILRYVRLGWEMGERLTSQITDHRVQRVHRLSGMVNREKHRLLGFIRFLLLPTGLLYSVIAPDFNLLPLVAPCFTNRLPHQQWIIHDQRRKSVALFTQGTLQFLEEELLSPNSLLTEDLYQELWKVYFKNISIRERFNPRAQRSRMPKKHWTTLPEKEP